MSGDRGPVATTGHGADERLAVPATVADAGPDEVPEPPPGCRWEWSAEAGFHSMRVVTEHEVARWERGDIKGCRWGGGYGTTACHARPTVAMNRGTTSRPRWWLYCSEHLFGRRIRGGVVEGRRAVEVEPGSAREEVAEW